MSSTLLPGALQKAWHFPASGGDSLNAGNSVTSPKVVLNNNGQAVMIWISDGLHRSVYRDGQWSAAEEISAAGGSPNSPDVAMDDDGNIIIVWRQNDGAGHHVYKSEYRNGSWTNPSGINDHISPSGGDTSHFTNCVPSVEMDHHGNAVIAWVQAANGSSARVFKSEYRNGVWTHPSLTDYFSPEGADPATDLSEAPHIAMNDNGQILIVWKQDAGAVDSIFKSESRNGVWSHPANINDSIATAADGDFPSSPGIEVDLKGDRGSITWIQRNASSRLQIFQTELALGVWSAVSSLTDLLNADAGLNVTNYRLASDPENRKTLMWTRTNGAGNQDVLRADFRDQSWSVPEILAENVSLTVSTSLQLEMSANDTAVAIWGYGDFTDSSFFRSHSSAGRWSQALDFSAEIKRAGLFVYSNDGQMAMNDAGEIIYSWIEYLGGSSYLMRAEYR